MRKGCLLVFFLIAWLSGVSNASTTTHASTSSSNSIHGLSNDVVQSIKGACKPAGICNAHMHTDCAIDDPAGQCPWSWVYHFNPIYAAHQHKIYTHASQQHLQLETQPAPLIWPVVAITVIVACCLAMQLYWAHTTQPVAGHDSCDQDYSKHVYAGSNTIDHHSQSNASTHSKAAATQNVQDSSTVTQSQTATVAGRQPESRRSAEWSQNEVREHSKHPHLDPALHSNNKAQQEQSRLGCRTNTGQVAKLQAVTVLANYPHAPGSLQEDRVTLWTDTVENVQHASEPVGPSCLGCEFSRSNTEVMSSIHHTHADQQQHQKLQAKQGQQQQPAAELGLQQALPSQHLAQQCSLQQQPPGRNSKQETQLAEQQQPQTAASTVQKHQNLQLVQQQWVKHDPELQSRRTEMLRQVEQLFSNRSARLSRSGSLKRQPISQASVSSQPRSRNLHFVHWHGTIEALQTLSNNVTSTNDQKSTANLESAPVDTDTARKGTDIRQQQLNQQSQRHQTSIQPGLAVTADMQGADLSSSVFLLDLIGSGASGQVFRGFWHGEEVAVKTVMFQDTAQDSTGASEPNSALHHAIREAAVCNTLVHPHVVFTHTYDIAPVASQAIGSTAPQQQPASEQLPVTVTIQNDWKLFLVQELCHANLHAALVESVLHDASTKAANMAQTVFYPRQGLKSYQRVIKHATTQLTKAMILPLLLDIASGMEFIHSKNIIHGDLKPENVLLKAEPAAAIGMVAKVTDFGLCKTLHADQYHITGYRLGTPFYAAPEVVQDGQLTKASDVYSFGVLMWVLFRCMPPWVLENGTYTRNVQLGRYRLGAPASYVLLTIRCMAPSPSHRPTFTEIRAALMGMLQCYHQGWLTLRPPVKPFPLGPAPSNQHITQQSVTQTLTVG